MTRPPTQHPADRSGALGKNPLLRRFLADWVAPRWAQLVYALMLTSVLAACTGAYPLIIKASFDALNSGQTQWLPYVIGGIIAVTAARSLFLYLQTIETNRIVLRMTTDMQKVAFSHLLDADFARLARDTPGRLMSALTNDIGFVQQAVQSTLNTAIRDSLSILTLVGAMFYLDWALSLIVLGVYPIAAWPIAAVSKRLRRVAKQTQSELGDSSSLLTEKLSGARLIKSYGLEAYASGQVHRSFEQLFSLRMKATRARARLDPMLEALGGLAVAGVIGFATWRISSGISTVGDFMGFVTALLMAAQPIRAIGTLPAKLQEGLAAAESFYGLLDEKPTIVDRPGAAALVVSVGAVTFDRVGFVYDNAPDAPALRDFMLAVPGGKTAALVGRSGAGKTTVINLVPRLFDPTGGSILIDGQDVRDVTLASLRRAVSIVSQDVTLFDDTIGNNIALGRLGASEADIIAAAKAAAAHEFILAQPQGYQTELGDRGLRLSGGQRQRIALARAILKDAPILLLDEATSALDTESERLVQEALATFTRGRTTIVIAHRLSTVRDADIIAVVDAGAIVETGTHSDLLARDGAYARLVRSQALAA
jgi:ATP-binding cassette, subfamily B, bacterial MsbA